MGCIVECEEGFFDATTCPHYNIERVSSLKEMNSLKWLIGTILKESNVYIIRGFLENENIPYQFKNISFHTGVTPIEDLMKVCL